MSRYLYEKLLVKPYPKKQYMDKESILWLENHLDVCVTMKDVKNRFYELSIGKFPIDKLDFNSEIYKKNNCFGIHGIRHQFRVSLYIWILIQYYNIELEFSNIVQLLQAALYHDILRKNDNTDANHGKKSALWIKSKYNFIDYKIIDAISNHDVIIKDYTIYDILVKSGDALDRYRLPKENWWVKKEYLLMNIDDEIFEICKFITLFIEKQTYEINDADKLIEEIILCTKEINLI